MWHIWVPIAVWQPCELLYTCHLLTYGIWTVSNLNRCWMVLFPLPHSFFCYNNSCLFCYSVGIVTLCWPVWGMQHTAYIFYRDISFKIYLLQVPCKHYTIRDAILTCARKPTWVSLIYRTEPTTKKCKKKQKKYKVKTDMLRSEVNSPGNTLISPEEERKATVGRVCRKVRF